MARTFYRTSNEDINHPEKGLIIKKGDRVLTSDVWTNTEGKNVLKVLDRYWFEYPASAFKESDVELFTI